MGGRKYYREGMTEADLADLLRNLADRIEGRDVDALNTDLPDAAAFRKLKIGVKRELSGLAVKIKSKAPDPAVAGEGAAPDRPADDPVKMKYKSLKKQMKKSFKAITESLLAETFPGEAEVTRFLQDSRLMVTYSGYGDPHYPDYEAACERFREAYEKKDLPACREACIALDQLKKSCHAQYK